MEEKKWIVNARQRCDLEMLLVGGFHPVTGFLTQSDYMSVLTQYRLADGQLWPMPIVLDVDEAFAKTLQINEEIKLLDMDNTPLAYLRVTDKWKPNKLHEAQCLFGTIDSKHPGVDVLFNQTGEWYLGGSLCVLQLPVHYDFQSLRQTPLSLKQYFLKHNYQNVVGFQTRNPMHRGHVELTLRAAKQLDGHLLIHPVVGVTKLNDVDYYTRVRCYQKILPHYLNQSVTLSLLPLAMRMAGPREALWHAMIRKNYGCTHFIIGRDHAGPGNDSNGHPFYSPYAAQSFVMRHQAEIGIQVMPFQEMVYVKQRQKYCPINELTISDTPLSISGTELRAALSTGDVLPEWFTFPEVFDELRQAYPPKHQRGMTIFFTGLSGAGKTSLAKALMATLMSFGINKITLLDGDGTRRILSSELGFSRADRDLNVCRIGYVATEITKVGGIAICAVIAPYESARQSNRRCISQYGEYIEIYLSTSLAVCKMRDTKGLYRRAEKGELKNLTGVNDPYEIPENPDIVIDTKEYSIKQSVDLIVAFLLKNHLIKITTTVPQMEELNEV